jgi:hypothetical protein
MLGTIALGQALSCSPNCAENLGPGLAIVSGVVLLGTATSAVYGLQETGRCREAMSAFQSRESGAVLRP